MLFKQIEAGKQLDAFSIQLVILAIWNQALHICHTQAASAMEGSPSQETTRFRRSASKKHNSPDVGECLDVVSSQVPDDVSSRIEREFLREVEHAEELAKIVEPGMDLTCCHYLLFYFFFFRPFVLFNMIFSVVERSLLFLLPFDIV